MAQTGTTTRSTATSSDPLAAWAALLQTHAVLIEQLEDDLAAGSHLPPTWFEVLARLAAAEDGVMRMQDLAEAAWLSKSGMTRLVDRMQEAGLVERQACATDRRVTYAAITPAGRTTLQRAIPVHRAAVERAFARHLTDAERGQLQALLGKVLAGNGRAPDQTCDPIDATS